MPDDLDSDQQLEDEVATDQPQARERRSFGRKIAECLLEIFNPVDALGELVGEPELGLVVLEIVLVAVAAALVIGLIGLIGWGFWTAVQEAFFGGGPPQGLGLK